MLTVRLGALCGVAALVSLFVACGPDEDVPASDRGMAGAGGEATSSGGSDSGGSSSGGSGMAGSGTGGASSGTPDTELETGLWDLYTLYCQRIFDCPVANDDTAWVRAAYATPEACGQGIAEVLARTEQGRLYELGIAEGTLVFSEEHLSAAKERLSTCQGFLITDALSLRDALVEGTIALGEPCRAHEECAGEAYCAAAANSCGGICTARLDVGAQCDDRESCKNETTLSKCRYDEAQNKDVCQPLFGEEVGAGEPCEDLGASSGAHLCPEGYFCDLESGALPVCRLPYLADEECFGGDSACEIGYVCGRTSGTYSCQKFKMVEEAGAPCDDDDATAVQYGVCNSVLGLVCESGKCRLYRDGDVGDPCTGVDFLRTMSCKDGLYCDETDHCAQLLADGADCSSNSACSGSCTDAGKCASPVCVQ